MRSGRPSSTSTNTDRGPLSGYGLCGRSACGPGLSCPEVDAGIGRRHPRDYTGGGYAFFNTEDSYAVLPAPFNSINNNSYSFYNHGEAGSVEDVRLYRGDNRTGDTFLLCRNDSISELPPNADVDPPDANWPGRGWRDQVSGHTWGNYC